MPERTGSRVLVLGLAALIVLPAIVFFGLHATTPSDGTRMNPAANPWRADGVILSPIEATTGPLLPGDLVTAVDGISLESWARSLLRFDLPRPRWEFGQTVLYSLRRDGQHLVVPVVLGRYPLGALLAQDWNVFLSGLVSLGVMLFLYLNRPREPIARVFLIASAALLSSTAWSSGLLVTDLTGAWGFWLHQASTIVAYILIWVCFLHAVLVFPRRHRLLQHRPWVVPALYLAPYVVHGLYLPLSAIGSSSVLDWLSRSGDDVRVVAVVYSGLAGVLAITSYRSLRDPIARLQVRWVLFAAAVVSAVAVGLGFLPELFSGAPLVPWGWLSLAGLLVPVALVIAVLRYRLFDIDLIINRTLVYVPLTAMLAGGYAASIKLFQVFFVSATGNESDAAIILTTLALASAFTPVKNSLQERVDRRFQEPHGPARQLRAFDQQVQSLVEALDPHQSVRRLLDLAVEAYGSRGGAVFMKENGREVLIHSTAGWSGKESLRVPLEWRGTRVGRISLGPRRLELARPSLTESELEQCAQRVAHLVWLVGPLRAAPAARRRLR